MRDGESARLPKTSVWNGLVPRLSTFESAPASKAPFIFGLPFKYRAASFFVILSIVLALAKWFENGYSLDSWSNIHKVDRYFGSDFQDVQKLGVVYFDYSRRHLLAMMNYA
ncbi:hypothetical protein WAI453_007502 [Rhynchosporium graminicola]